VSDYDVQSMHEKPYDRGDLLGSWTPPGSPSGPSPTSVHPGGALFIQRKLTLQKGSARLGKDS
jgi:hypothetical protein